MVDFRKAFDLVDHKILLKKLSVYRCSNITLSWFSSYLSNRSQMVTVNGIRSEKETVSCGIPRGSILGPLLFLLPLTLKEVVSAVDLYPDDTTIYDIQTDKTSLQKNLQSALSPQYFNTDRSKAVLLLWFLTVTCSCCPYLYFGSAIMLVTYFINFR